jgi:NitT/TauT family transport system ATP-binding protein
MSATDTPLRLIIHAVDAESLKRARNNAANLVRAEPQATVEIVANAQAVTAALDNPHEQDRLLRICANTLDKLGRQAPDGIIVVEAAVVHIARRQQAGWAYIRA